MKNILKKLAAIADEADSTGNLKIANEIDLVIKALASGADYGTSEDVTPASGVTEGMSMVPEEDKQKSIGTPGPVLSDKEIAKRKRDAALRKQLEIAKASLQEIASAYTESGNPAPFSLKSGPLSYKDLMSILAKAEIRGQKMDQGIRSFKDIHANIQKISQLVSVIYTLGAGQHKEKDPFGGPGDVIPELKGVVNVMQQGPKLVAKK